MTQFTLRPYQHDAVRATIQHFKRSNSPAVIVLPTGAGKSLVIAELASLAKHPVLVLTHVKELVEQNQAKFASYGLSSSIFSAGLKQRDSSAKVVFASVQSAVRNLSSFTRFFSLVIIDECHRISDDEDSQYAKTLAQLKVQNSQLKVVGLTATPYRLDSGWIYQYHYRGFARSELEKPFVHCIYELPISYMIKHGYLTKPERFDAAVEGYNFDALPGYESNTIKQSDLNQLLERKQRVTRSIIDQVIEKSAQRQGVMIFAATVKHATEILSYLPQQHSAVITGQTHSTDRDALITRFKERELKFLVNVSVLTTGFDAPHVDVIALLRPTASVSLYQQIVGRGLRLFPGKKDCLVLDYTASQFNLFQPEVGEPKPDSQCEAVQVFCPLCEFANIFWGKCDENGHIIEHHGRRCQGIASDPITGSIKRCDFRFRFKNCPQCNAENDIAARSCATCQHALVDPDDQLKKALQLKDAKVIRCQGLSMESNGSKLKVTYHDEQGETLVESFDFGKEVQQKIFRQLFKRTLDPRIDVTKLTSCAQIIALEQQFIAPDFVIARKHTHYWRISERIFDYKGKYRKANQL
ncbi:MAG: DEAD/DEAH box helicase family protein [Pseudomonadales bacterium]